MPGPLHVLAALALAAWLAGRLPARPARRWRLAIGLAFAWTWLLATPAIGSWLAGTLERQHPTVALERVVRDERTVIVVLASGQMWRPDGRVDPQLDADGQARLLAAIGLWRQSGGRLIVAGGPGRGDHDSFAALMRRLAEQAGVPRAAILEAAGSRNTREDLIASAAWLRDHAGPRWLVTSALHMPRAAEAADRLGLQLRPFPCGHRHLDQPSWRAWLPDNGAPSLWHDALHEWIGLHLYRWRSSR